MSNAKHTPLSGPWELVETHQEGILNSWHIQIGEDPVQVFPFKRIYNEDRTQSGFATDHDRMAAFRLATAAPELLEALQTLLAYGLKMSGRHEAPAFEAARAAIAKATGEQQC